MTPGFRHHTARDVISAPQKAQPEVLDLKWFGNKDTP
jgi:hypothetical protein